MKLLIVIILLFMLGSAGLKFLIRVGCSCFGCLGCGGFLIIMAIISALGSAVSH